MWKYACFPSYKVSHTLLRLFSLFLCRNFTIRKQSLRSQWHSVPYFSLEESRYAPPPQNAALWIDAGHFVAHCSTFFSFLPSYTFLSLQRTLVYNTTHWKELFWQSLKIFIPYRKWIWASTTWKIHFQMYFNGFQTWVRRAWQQCFSWVSHIIYFCLPHLTVLACLGLEFLNLEHNDFSSTLPDSIGHLQQLSKWFLTFDEPLSFFLCRAELTVSQLSILAASLVLSFNKFEGFLPRAWTDMQSLRYLLLVSSLHPCGRVWFLLLTCSWQINFFWQDHNRLEGTLSMKMFGQMPMLETFQLDYNSMTGSLPKQLGGMTRLGNLTLIGNSFVGSMPSQLCELKEIGSLETLTADCGLVTCGCCDNCANKLSWKDKQLLQHMGWSI